MTTLFDQWVGRAPSAFDIETRGTPRTHLSDRASAVPQVSMVTANSAPYATSADGITDKPAATSRYSDANSLADAFLEHYGYSWDGRANSELPDDTDTDYLGQPFPTEITAPRGNQPAVRRATGSATDATDDAAMVWPIIRYAVAHDEKDHPATFAKRAPIYVYNEQRELIRVDQQRISRIGRVNHGRPERGKERNNDGRSKVARKASDANNPRFTCSDCKRQVRKAHNKVTDKVCVPCGNDRLAPNLETHILTES